MATAEADTSRDERVPPGGVVYDAFISYSHAADDLLAPRLQAGLQRFAKPWWKRRALRIFRDESSLSANPHLWSSITAALDNSGWFVLLLSPDAAQSPWVNNEVEYWLEHKDPERIIPVLTDGEFGWADGDVTGDAAPGALQAAFADEPRWVDLSFARDDDQLDLQDPRFADAVADIASAIRGVPKDELASEEVRQHRRTRRTAFGAGIALLALAVAAGGAALFANAQRIEADEQRAAAESERDRADSEADRANAAATEATQNAAIADSERLAAEAVNSRDRDPELSMLLALESIATVPESTASAVGVIALREAMTQNRLQARFPTDAARTVARLSAAASTIYYTEDMPPTVTALDVASGDELWTYAPDSSDAFVNLALSPDENLIAVAVFNADSDDGLGGRVEVIDAANGEPLRTLTPGSCRVTQTLGNSFSPDGQWLALWTGTEDCFANPDADWITLYNTNTWEEEAQLQLDRVSLEALAFSGDGSRIVIYNPQPERTGAGAEVRSFPDLELITLLPDSRAAALNRDGTVAAAVVDELGEPIELRPQLIRVDTGERIAYLDAVDDFPQGWETFRFSPSGSVITVVTRGDDYVFDAENGQQLIHLGNTGWTDSQSLSGDGSKLLTTTTSAIQLWNIGAGVQAATPIVVNGTRADWINPNEALDGPNLAAFVFQGEADQTVLLDPNTGAVIASIDGEAEQLSDGRFVVARKQTGAAEDPQFGPLVAWDPESGSVVELSPCVVPEATLRQGVEVPCPEPFFGFTANTVEASFNGATFAAQSYVPDGSEIRMVRVWDAATLDILFEVEIPKDEGLQALGSTWLVTADEGGLPWMFVRDLTTGDLITQLDGPWEVKAITPDGSTLFANDSGRLFAYDTSTWELIATWQGHDANIRGGAVSPDGGRLATTAEDNFVKIWDITELGATDDPPTLLDRFPADFPSDAAWLGDDELGVFLGDGARYVRVSLSVPALVAAAHDRLTRSFTVEECATFGIDPCPTLDDIRSR